MLQEEALIIAEKLGIEGFAPSNGWLESFKKTQNISTMSVAGEEGDVTSMTLESWKERSRELVYSLTAVGVRRALIDFTLSNARRFYSSMGNPSARKGLEDGR